MFLTAGFVSPCIPARAANPPAGPDLSTRSNLTAASRYAGRAC